MLSRGLNLTNIFDWFELVASKAVVAVGIWLQVRPWWRWLFEIGYMWWVFGCDLFIGFEFGISVGVIWDLLIWFGLVSQWLLGDLVVVGVLV